MAYMYHSSGAGSASAATPPPFGWFLVDTRSRLYSFGMIDDKLARLGTSWGPDDVYFIIDVHRPCHKLPTKFNGIFLLIKTHSLGKTAGEEVQTIDAHP